MIQTFPSNCARLAGAFLFLGAAACGRGDATGAAPESDAKTFDPANAKRAAATLVGPDGVSLGAAAFEQTASGVLITATLRGLPAGTHAIHIHEKGACKPDFEAAGAHFAPEAREHGFLAAEGPHAGDMPNLHVADGEDVKIEIMNERISLEKGGTGSLFDADGSALVIHSGADDYASQPSGDAGGRIACGVIEAAGAGGG